jgi:hypothetical protein
MISFERVNTEGKGRRRYSEMMKNEKEKKRKGRGRT